MEWLSLDPALAAFLLGTAFCAGLVDAIAGGGGLLMLPALLSAGVPPHLALGTNKLSGTFGTYTAARLCLTCRVVRPHLLWLSALATFNGALLGTLCAWLVSAAWLHKLLPLVIIAAAVYVLLVRPHADATTPSFDSPPPRRRSLILGHALGFYDGFIGPGAGVFWTLGALGFYRVNLVEAACIARSMNFVSNLVALTTFAWLGSVDLSLGLGLGAALMVGAYVGAHSALRYGAALIRPVFISVVFITAGRLAWLAWFQ